jgi:hypothetical protein
MRYRFAALAAVAGIVAGAAFAAATPVRPPPGAVVTTAHPQFTWTVPSNEQTDAIFIANKPDVTPEGKFYDENVVDGEVFTTAVNEWSPSSPLYAGRYWWNLWSHDVNTFANFYSAPVDFSIPVTLRLVAVTAKRYIYMHSLDVEVRWTANVQRPLIRVRLVQGRKIIWKAGETDITLIGSPGSTIFRWGRPRRIKQGTRLTLQVSLLASGAKTTRVLVVRAP